MIARKCDRCGVCFDPFEEDGVMAEFKNPIFRTRDDIRDHKIGMKLMPDEQTDAYVDLCPECTKKFIDFMDCEKNEDYEDEKTKIKSAGADILYRFLCAMGLGDLVCDDGGGAGNNDAVRDGKPAERKGEAVEECSDRGEI